MTPLDFIFWAIEFSLEGFGADYAFKRKIWPLFAYLLFRFWADFIGFIVFWAYGQSAFYWADWWQRAVQYPLMAVLLVWTIGGILKADKPAVRVYAAVLCAAGAAGIAFYRGSTLLTSNNLMRLELGVNMILCAMLCGAWAMRTAVSQPRAGIAAGIIVQVGSEALLTLGLLKGLDTSKYYSVFATIALITWCAAVRPKFQVSEARLGIGARGFGR